MNAAKLLGALALNTTLRRLNLAWNGIRHVGTMEIAVMLAAPGSALEELDLRDNPLGAQDALGLALAQHFASAPKRHRASLEKSMTMTDAGFPSSPTSKTRVSNKCLRVL